MKLISEKIGGVCALEELHLFNMSWYIAQIIQNRMQFDNTIP